ncbi:MAG: hypothetical protein ACYDAB_15775 [bacterium]
MRTYWILDARAGAEITDLNREVFSVEIKALGLSDLHRSYAGPRFIVLDLDDNEIENLGLLSRLKHGWHSPYSSKEEVELVAQRLNTGSNYDPPRYQLDFLAHTESLLCLQSIRKQDKQIRALCGIGIDERSLDAAFAATKSALKRAKSEWRRRIEGE